MYFSTYRCLAVIICSSLIHTRLLQRNLQLQYKHEVMWTDSLLDSFGFGDISDLLYRDPHRQIWWLTAGHTALNRTLLSVTFPKNYLYYLNSICYIEYDFWKSTRAIGLFYFILIHVCGNQEPTVRGYWCACSIASKMWKHDEYVGNSGGWNPE